MTMPPSIWPDIDELTGRWKNLQQRMAENGLGGLLIYQNADLLYLCGTTQVEAAFLPRSGLPLVMARPPLERPRSEVPWTEVVSMPGSASLGAVLKDFAGRDIHVLGLELDVLPAAFYERLRKGALAGFEIRDASMLIREVRSVKSGFEIRLIREAADRMAGVYAVIPEMLFEGMSEAELEGLVMARARAKEHQGIIRSRGFNMELTVGHVLSGENGLVPAKVASPTGGTGISPGFGQGAGLKLIKKNELVSIDLCGGYGGYVSDQTRIFYTGRTPGEVRQIYDRLIEVVDEINTWIKPGMPVGGLYARSFELAEKKGLAKGFMGLGEYRCPFVGHGIGLELDEWPPLAKGLETALRQGMVYAFEPRVFMPGVGVVGIEDTYLMTEDGPERLTPMSREIREVYL